ncbi:hypothetical protein D3C74_264840 [compost metagenome]
MPVDRVIGGHDRIGTALLHRHFEALQIYFPERAFRHDSIYSTTVLLLIVTCEMLQRSIGAAFFNTAGARYSKCSGNKRVL